MSDPNAPDWEELVQQHAERVFRIAFRILGSTHDAEDISQDVFTEALTLHQSEPVRTWTGLMVRLATLRSIDKLRREKFKPETLQNPVTDSRSVESPDQTLIAAELANQLRLEIKNLPQQQAAIFSLAYFEQLSRSEIASALAIPPESVSTALYKARKKLSSRLAVIQGTKS